MNTNTQLEGTLVTTTSKTTGTYDKNVLHKTLPEKWPALLRQEGTNIKMLGMQ